jgi:hypothetical protein
MLVVKKWAIYMTFYSLQQIRKEINIMRKKIPVIFFFIAFLVPFVLSSCVCIPTPVPIDSDKDGVFDNYDYRYDFTTPQYYDKCPETPTGVKVDKYGCPVDTDEDGVPDYLDKCSGTSKGVKVDRDGCPLDKSEPAVAAPQPSEPVKKATPAAAPPKASEPVKAAVPTPAKVQASEPVKKAEPAAVKPASGFLAIDKDGFMKADKDGFIKSK